MAELLAPEPSPLRHKMWTPGPVLDQGQTPQCIGFGTEGTFLAEPSRILDGPTPQEIYAGAQSLDGDPYPHDGSTVRASLKWLQQQGYVKSYHWATSVDVATQWILQRGCLLTGFPWVLGMEEPTRAGRMRLLGEQIGGHCTFWYGVDLDKSRIYMQNSWGDGWALKGQAWMSLRDFGRLMETGAAEVVGLIEAERKA